MQRIPKSEVQKPKEGPDPKSEFGVFGRLSAVAEKGTSHELSPSLLGGSAFGSRFSFGLRGSDFGLFRP
jgi:hypothetical protein